MTKKPKQNIILLDWQDGTSIGLSGDQPIKWTYVITEDGKGCPALLDGQEYEVVGKGEIFITPSQRWTALFDGWNCMDAQTTMAMFHGMSPQVH